MEKHETPKAEKILGLCYMLYILLHAYFTNLSQKLGGKIWKNDRVQNQHRKKTMMMRWNKWPTQVERLV